MKALLKPIRAAVGGAVLFFDRTFSPEPIERAPERQKEIDRETSKLALYEFEACPFCVRVRREMRRLALNIERRDVAKSKKFEEELLAGGGEYQVPCLRIELPDGKVQWMYESADIVRYLRERYT
jgi:glutaredoxin